MRRALLLAAFACHHDPAAVEARTVDISPPSPVQGRDALRCGAPADVEVRWRVDGADTAHTGPHLPAEATRAGRHWVCEGQAQGQVFRGEVEVAPLGGNVLLIVLDDVGTDRIRAYDAHPNPVDTPVIDGLIDGGVRFDRAWATPVCSPTRATLMTGRLPGRYGLGHIVSLNLPAVILPEEEVYLPELLSAADPPYTSALVGKWHLSSKALEHAQHPGRGAGFARYAGPLENLGVAATAVPTPRNYFRWEENEDGVFREQTGYATAHQVQGALDRIADLPEPWFLYLAFNAAHIPLHAPPDGAAYTPPADTSALAQHRAMVESVDRAIGQVLDGLDPQLRARTTVLLIGDNGTRTDLADPPIAPAGKGEVYEGGIRVPFVVSGAAVRAPGVSEALIHTVDVFDTLAALTGVDLPALDARTGAAAHPRDSRSFLPQLGDPASPSARQVNVTEWFSPNGPPPWSAMQRAATDGRFKLIEARSGEAERVELYDLSIDPGETDNLLVRPLEAAAATARERLAQALAAQTGRYDLPW